MKITINYLKLNNFKGQKSLEVKFTQETTIIGDNGTGKTSIFDAFTWCLFGKDSCGRADFNIKPLDANNEPTHKVEYSVECGLMVDDSLTVFKRVLREKWGTKRGSANEEFGGHEATYFINDVPASMKEYEKKVNDLCGESLFKLLTSPTYFIKLPPLPTASSIKMGIKSQRDILFEASGVNAEDNALMASDAKFSLLLQSMSGKTLSEFSRELAENRKNAKKEKDTIQPRIDEVERSIPEYNASIEKEMDELQARLDAANVLIQDAAKANESINNEKLKVQRLINQAKEKQATILHSEKMRANENVMDSEQQKAELEQHIAICNISLGNSRKKVKSIEEDIQNIETQLTNLRNDFTIERDKTFNPNDDACPTCGRPFDNHQEREYKFNSIKAKKLADINAKGLTVKAEHDRLNEELALEKKRLSEIENDIAKESELLKNTTIPPIKEINPETIPEWVEQQSIIDKLLNYEEINPVTPDEAIAEREKIYEDIKNLTRQKALQDNIPNQRKRIDELDRQMKSLAQEIASYERLVFMIEEYTRYKASKLEGTINNLFPNVRYKLFDNQINGGVNEVCVPMINGVPYPDLNSASKIWAGLEIINALSAHYNIVAPIFIDNRESITRIPETKAQIINLFKNDKEKKLKVENK